VVAVLLEPIQGEGGINLATESYLTELHALCGKHEILLMLDEVQTGNGRTGKWFSYQHTTMQPDVLITAKGLGNGVPIGACLAKQKVAALFAPGSHGSTFGGNPLACRAALATIDTIESNSLLVNATQIGAYMSAKFAEKLADCEFVKDIRGKGLMLGIELSIPCTELVDLCLAQKLLINVTAEKVIRLLPPLILDEEQADKIIHTVVNCIKEFTSSVKQPSAESA